MWFNYEWPTVECLELQVKTLERHALSLSSSCRDFRLFVAYDGCLGQTIDDILLEGHPNMIFIPHH